MRLSRVLATAVGTTVLTATLALPSAAQASPRAATQHTPGTASLAALLTSDGNTFDRNPRDYDIVTEAVLAVLAAKPNSPVGVLTDGKTAVTAFIPNDQAFRLLVQSLTGKYVKDEKAVFTAVAGLGIDTVETVLLYHVVPGATITAATALRSNGAALTTAQGGTVTVKVTKYRHWCPVLSLVDKDADARNPQVVAFNLNKGNLQIAHGIDRVLRPLDL
jgi:uncharacterized surface protein with fasciclin (FAS1) repeats